MLLRLRNDVRNPSLIHLLVERRQLFVSQLFYLSGGIADQWRQFCQLLFLLLLAPPKTRPNLARATALGRAKDRASIQMAVLHSLALRAHEYISQQSCPPFSATRPPPSVFLRGLSADQL